MQTHDTVNFMSAQFRSHTLGSLLIRYCIHSHLHNPFTSSAPVVCSPVPSHPPLPIPPPPTPPSTRQSLFQHVIEL